MGSFQNPDAIRPFTRDQPHSQLAKLRQEGKVHNYNEEFQLLQILVRGWSKEELVGTLIDGLRPWLAKELKLK